MKALFCGLATLAGPAALFSLAIPGTLAAQEGPALPSVALVAQFGRVHPSADLVLDEVREGGWSQEGSWYYGGGVEVPFSRRGSVQILLGRAAASVEGYGTSWEGYQGSSRTVSTIGRLSYLVTPEADWGIALMAGGGVLWESLRTISSSGTVAPSTGVRSWPVITAGVEGRYRLHEQFTLLLALEGTFYTAKFRGAATSREVQRDLRTVFGVALPLNFR